MDDIASVVGYTNARNLQLWWAGRQLYVPRSAYAEHPLARLLDLRLLRALVARYPGAQIQIPTEAADRRGHRERLIAERLADGVTPADIAERLGLTTRRVEQIREELVLRGWLELARANRRYRMLEPSADDLEIFRTGDLVRDTPSPAQAGVRPPPGQPAGAGIRAGLGG